MRLLTRSIVVNDTERNEFDLVWTVRALHQLKIIAARSLASDFDSLVENILPEYYEIGPLHIVFSQMTKIIHLSNTASNYQKISTSMEKSMKMHIIVNSLAN